MSAARPAGVLYAEDFDDPPPPAAPPPPPPELFDADQLEAARQAAYAEGVAAGEAQAASRQRQAVAATLGRIADGLAQATAAAAAQAEAAAGQIAGLLLACLGRVLPELCRRHAEAEARAVARAVLPGLLAEPQITVRAAPGIAEAVADEITAHDPDLTARLRVQPLPGIAPGDVRIAWADGQATRDAAALWRGIAEVLEPLGLYLPDPPAPTRHVPAQDAAAQDAPARHGQAAGSPDDRAQDDRAPDDHAPDDHAPDDRAPDDRAPDDHATGPRQQERHKELDKERDKELHHAG